ncbi:MAG: hypothetical protein QME46_04775 [Thermoanaerobacteraceae bacterium]|nr:hypothetical protein [Thermoanaerobacteraceae bacterium]
MNVLRVRLIEDFQQKQISGLIGEIEKEILNQQELIMNMEQDAGITSLVLR